MSITNAISYKLITYKTITNVTPGMILFYIVN